MLVKILEQVHVKYWTHEAENAKEKKIQESSHHRNDLIWHPSPPCLLYTWMTAFWLKVRKDRSNVFYKKCFLLSISLTCCINKRLLLPKQQFLLSFLTTNRKLKSQIVLCKEIKVLNNNFRSFANKLGLLVLKLKKMFPTCTE